MQSPHPSRSSTSLWVLDCPRHFPLGPSSGWNSVLRTATDPRGERGHWTCEQRQRRYDPVIFPPGMVDCYLILGFPVAEPQILYRSSNTERSRTRSCQFSTIGKFNAHGTTTGKADDHVVISRRQNQRMYIKETILSLLPLRVNVICRCSFEAQNHCRSCRFSNVPIISLVAKFNRNETVPGKTIEDLAAFRSRKGQGRHYTVVFSTWTRDQPRSNRDIS